MYVCANGHPHNNSQEFNRVKNKKWKAKLPNFVFIPFRLLSGPGWMEWASSSEHRAHSSSHSPHSRALRPFVFTTVF